MYGGETISVGAEVFIWFSETKQGSGLVWLGLAERVIHANPPTVMVRLIDNYQGAGFGITQLQRHRDADDETPIVSLTKKLYAHSHEKTAHLTAEEADLLRTQFVIALI